MRRKILAFAGSNSSKSINKQLVAYAAGLVTAHDVTIIDLSDYPLPVYSLDIELGDGPPANVQKLVDLFEAHDAFLISIPEHNSSFPAVFKNTVDWMSRVGKRIFGHKPVAVLSATPGRGGGKYVRESMTKLLSGFLSGAEVGSVGVPQFQQHFESADGAAMGINNPEVDAEVRGLLQKLEAELDKPREVSN